MNSDFSHVPATAPLPMSASGGRVVACTLDQTCARLDCQALAEAIAPVLTQAAEAPDYVMHYCGIDYLDQAAEAARSAARK